MNDDDPTRLNGTEFNRFAQLNGVLTADADQRALPAIESVAALCARALPPPPELVEGVLHQGGKMVLGGGSKSFKTWILADLAVSVATGAPWLAQETIPARVLYLNLEIQAPFFRERLLHICQAKGIPPPPHMDVWNLRGHAADLRSLRPHITERIRDSEYGLIVLDPIYKVLGGRDENAAGDVSELLNEIEALTVESGAAVVFGAHFSKGNQAAKDAIDRIGGSGVFARDPDSILTLTRHEEDDAFVAESILRNHPPLSAFCVRWDFPLMRRAPELDPQAIKQPKKPGSQADSVSDEQLLDLLRGTDGLTTGAWEKLAYDEFEASKSTFMRRLRVMKAARRIFKSEIDRTWHAK